MSQLEEKSPGRRRVEVDRSCRRAGARRRRGLAPTGDVGRGNNGMDSIVTMELHLAGLLLLAVIRRLGRQVSREMRPGSGTGRRFDRATQNPTAARRFALVFFFFSKFVYLVCARFFWVVRGPPYRSAVVFH